MKAIGKDRNGNIIEIDAIPKSTLYCCSMDLVELTIPEGVRVVYCEYNHLTKLTLPKSVIECWCYRNNLTELVLFEGLNKLVCWGNNLTDLCLPESLITLYAYKNKDLRLKYLPRTMTFLNCDRDSIPNFKVVPKNTRVAIFYR